MKAYWKYLIIGVAIVVSAWLLARAYTYKYHAQETIVVTGQIGRASCRERV